ncbi:MAG: fatty acid--CoA ligase [Pseudomonadota bacterium]
MSKDYAPTAFAYSYQLLIKHLLKSPLVYAPDQQIVYRDQLRYTYRMLDNRVSRLAHLLKQQGVGPGDTVGVMDWDSHRYLECFFAVPMMGAVLHTINIRLSPEQLTYTLNHAEDDVLLVNADFLPMIEAVRDKLESVKKIIILSDNGLIPDSSLSLSGEYEHLLATCPEGYEFPDFDENTVATTFYTTGTTGLPKGVYFTHRQLMLHTFAFSSVLAGQGSQFNVTSRDVYMPMTPMFHVHAWGVPYIMTLLGAKQVYPGRYEPEMLLRLVETEKVSFSHCVPTILHMLLHSARIEETNVAGWKMIIGGSALPRGLCKAAMMRGINLIAGYGMSETCPVITVASLKPDMVLMDEDLQAEARCRSGLPTPLVYVQAIGPDGTPQPHDGVSVGEVVVRSPWLTQGYFKEPEMSEALWGGGWLHTGDIGYFTKDGYLQVTDRVKDVIKTGGEWISSLDLEDFLSQHEAVSEAAVIGMPDEKWGERPMALVVLKDVFRGKIVEKDLKDFLMTFAENGRMPKYGVPGKIVIVDAIAKTSVGKIDKKNLRFQYKK